MQIVYLAIYVIALSQIFKSDDETNFNNMDNGKSGKH